MCIRDRKYGVQDSLLEQEPCEFKQSDSDSDVDYIKSQGKMIVGITAVSYTHLLLIFILANILMKHVLKI